MFSRLKQPVLAISISCSLVLLFSALLLLAFSNATLTSDVTKANVTKNSLPSSLAPQAPNNNLQDQRQALPRRRNGRQYTSSANENLATAYGAASAQTNQQQQTADGSEGADGETLNSVSVASANDPSAFSSFGERPPISHQFADAAGASQRQTHYSPLADSLDYQNSPPHSPSSSYYYAPVSARLATQNHHSLPLGYPSNSASDRYNNYETTSRQQLNNYWPSQGHSTGGFTSGLMSAAANGLTRWTKGFTLLEVVCGLVAISIGAIVLGAPFFLIYLVLMGNISTTGSLSLTNPMQINPTNSQTNTNQQQQNNQNNGKRRKKRSPAHFDDPTLVRQLETLGVLEPNSPFVKTLSEWTNKNTLINAQTIGSMVKTLLNSIDKFAASGKAIKP